MLVIELKKCIANDSILDVIINKFHYKKKLYPIILLKVDKDSEVDFHHTILLFSLAVYLQVQGGRKSLLNAKEIA